MTAYSPASYTVAGGSLRGPFPFTFAYLEDEFVKVKLNDADLLASDYTIETSPTTQVRLTSDAEAGDKIVVYRQSGLDERLVDWQDASVITEETMDRADDQLHHLVQEAYYGGFNALGQNAEGDWDAQGNRIINVGDPLDNKDAANKDYVDAQVLYDGAAVPQNWSFVTVTGSETQFTLTDPEPAAVDPRFYVVTVDGVTQAAVDDYYLTQSGGDWVLVFTNPGPISTSGQKVVIRNFGNARSILGNPVMPPDVDSPALALQGLTGQTEDVFIVYAIGGASEVAKIDASGNAEFNNLTVNGTLTATISGGSFTGSVTGDLTGNVLADNGAVIVESGADLASSALHGTFDGALDDASGTLDGGFLVDCIVGGGDGVSGILQIPPFSSNGIVCAPVLTGVNMGTQYGGRIYWDDEGPVLRGGTTGTQGTSNGCFVGVEVNAVRLSTNGGVGTVRIVGGGDLVIANSGNIDCSGKISMDANGTADEDLLRKDQIVALLPNVSAVADITEDISTTYAASSESISGGLSSVSKTRVDVLGSAAAITNSDDNNIFVTFYVDAANDTQTGNLLAQISEDGSSWTTVWEWDRTGGSGHGYNIPVSFFVPSGWQFRIGNDNVINTNNIRQVLKYSF